MYLLPCQEENNNQWDGERFSRSKKEKRQQQSQPNKFAEQIIDSHLDGTADQSPHFILAARKRQNKRGVTPVMAEYWVKTGKALQQAGDKVLYVTRQGAVVVNKAGQVITAYTSQDFDENMQRIVNQLFGK